MNFGFYNIVLITAVVILILTLTYIGVRMMYKKDTATFPPVVAGCPDYWIQNADQSCQIPNGGPMGHKNVPNSPITRDTTRIPGLYQDNNGNLSIDFNDPNWGIMPGKSTTCAKQDWANQYGIVWDGVTNYNKSC